MLSFTSSFAEGDYYFFGPEGKNSFLVICFKWLSSYGEIIMLIILKSVLWRGGEEKPPSEAGRQRESGLRTGCHRNKHIPFAGTETQLSGEQGESTCHGNRLGPPSGTPPRACSRAQGNAELLCPRAGCTVQPSPGLRSQKHTGNTVSTQCADVCTHSAHLHIWMFS